MVENYDYETATIKMKYCGNMDIDNVTVENVTNFIECVKCGINAFEDEVAEKLDKEDKPRFDVNIVSRSLPINTKPNSDDNE